MNVHIVCRDLHEDKILPRLARALEHGNDWSLSEEPRRDVDLNYWMVYIDYAERHSDWRATRTAAYFSHYEPQTKFKRMWWENASKSIDGCILTAKQYGRFLPVDKPKFVCCRPPIESIFIPHLSHRRASRSKRVGVSGFVDRSDRKGVLLLKQLSEQMPSVDFVAVGSGWSVDTRLVSFDELPDFYNSLDVFLCTSTVEGIPMPPLEALACGIPIVVPEGVGLLDDLPNVRGICRYPAGDIHNLKVCLELSLLDSELSTDALREVVSGYTEENWCSDHVQAFESMFGTDKNVSRLEPEPDRHGQRGVFYVAYGDPARRCAESAIQSFRQFMPDIPVALASDRPLNIGEIFVLNKDEDIGGRSVKTKIYDLSPREWQYIMYLDADTEVTADISFLFQLLEDDWDMVICKNPGKYHTIRYMERSDNKDECSYTYNLLGTDQLIQLNGGVFAFQRNERTHLFFDAWHEEWKRWGKRDQAALLRALFQNPVKLNVLTNVWNTITRYDSAESSAGILHYPMTARRWRGLIHDRLDSPTAWAQVDNEVKER